MSPFVVIVLVVAAVLVLWWILTFNGFVAKRNSCRNALSSIDVHCKKRHDLIPNIIESVKGYMAHERELLTELTERRERAVAAEPGTTDWNEAENQLGASLGAIRLRAEAYPELKASETFVNLQKTLTEVEEQISASRRAHNSAVERLNNGIQMFPSSIVASSMGLKQEAFFEAAEVEREPVKVDFS